MANSQLYLKSGFPRVPLSNGIGRYVCQLQRVTLKFCKNHGGSRGMRDFIEHDLVNYAKDNPGVVVYVKPRRHRGPVIKAEYLSGETDWIPCHTFTREDVVKHMELVRTQCYRGPSFRLRKYQHTEFPSIQGPWSPFTFRDPKLNITEFPNEEVGRCPKHSLTATEDIIKMFNEQKLDVQSSNQEISSGENVKK